MKRIDLASLVVFLFIGSATWAGPLTFEPAEYTTRRAKLMKHIPDGIAVIWGSVSGEQDNDFRYLCGVEVPRAVLIVDGIAKESHLFYTTSERHLKGEGMSPKLASAPKATTGVEHYHQANEFSAVLRELVGKTKIVYTPFKSEVQEPNVSSRSEWDGRPTRRMRFVELLGERFPEVEVKDCSATIWEMRRFKSPAEIKLLREAGRIGAEAMIEVMKAAKPGKYEYELASLFEYACKRKGCREMAFGTIISSGENHPFFHYQGYDRLLADGDFLVVDAGPKVDGYCTDITISFPANGKFSPRQREIYQACLEITNGCVARYRPGTTGYEIGKEVREELAEKGYDLTKDAFSKMRFFKEGGITHYVGLSVHDAGGSDLPPDRVLEPGMVFACEVFAAYPEEEMGIRIEYTLLLTETGCEILCPGIPREIDEIEALMQGQAKD